MEPDVPDKQGLPDAVSPDRLLRDDFIPPVPPTYEKIYESTCVGFDPVLLNEPSSATVTKTVCDCYKEPSEVVLGYWCGVTCKNNASEEECDERNCSYLMTMPERAAELDCGNQEWIRARAHSYGVAILVEVYYVGGRLGYGLKAKEACAKDQFLAEYLGECVTLAEMRRRSMVSLSEGLVDFYFMILTKHRTLGEFTLTLAFEVSGI